MKFTQTHLLTLGASALALSANMALADQVFNDDVIITQSLCVGNDCVNGESFGFDTIRLKENNTRIKFQDTSSSASFPTRDWQLTANDSSNGGANKFSIDDIDGGRTPFTVEAGAPSHSLYVDDAGRIGLGTATPVVELHVVNGDSPTLRLEQNGSSGFTPQTWDVAGNETNFFIRDATNGSQLPFKIRPGADNNSLYIDADNDVGLSTASPDADLHVIGSSFRIENADSGALTTTGVLHTRGTGGELVLFESTDDNFVQVRMKTNSGNRRFLATSSADAVENQIVFDTTEIRLAGATDTTNLWATVNASGINLPAGAAFSVDATNLDVPDYVFDPEYDLMPLDQLQTFIIANSHLPKVPSATEVQASGLNMTEMQLTLLEKVEELTLYTLQQQEMIDALQEKLDAQ